MTTTQEGPSLAQVQAPPTPVQQAKIKWVKVWAFGGVVWLGMCLYSVTRWLLGGFAHPVEKGPDPVPTFMLIGIWAWVAVWAVCIVAAVYFAVWKPWKRDGRLGLDGFLVLAITTMWFQDPAINYSQAYFTYNAHIPNLGCPMCFTPGWQSHFRNLADGLFSFPWYIAVVWLCVVAGCKIVNLLETRWPKLGRFGALGVLFVFAILFDIVNELAWLVPGVYIYLGPTTETGPILFAGHYYQLPLIEVLFAGLFYIPFVCLRLYRNDKGQTIAERGLESLRGTNRQRSVVRWLALVGVCNLAFFLAYNVPVDWVSRHWSSTVEDVYSRSYFVGDNCGPLAERACPDARLPMQTNSGNLYVTPDGKIVTPKGGLPIQKDNGN